LFLNMMYMALAFELYGTWGLMNLAFSFLNVG